MAIFDYERKCLIWLSNKKFKKVNGPCEIHNLHDTLQLNKIMQCTLHINSKLQFRSIKITCIQIKMLRMYIYNSVFDVQCFVASDMYYSYFDVHMCRWNIISLLNKSNKNMRWWHECVQYLKCVSNDGKYNLVEKISIHLRLQSFVCYWSVLYEIIFTI